MKKKLQLSASKIALFAKCRLAYRFRYIDKVTGQRSEALSFGTLVHSAIEGVYRWVQQEEFSGTVPKDVVLREYERAFAMSDVSHAHFFDEGLELVRMYFRTNWEVDHFSVLALEKSFSIDVDQFRVIGFIDRIDRVDHETIRVVDYKTNRIPYTDDEIDQNLQMSIYGLAAAQLWPWARKVIHCFDMLRHDEQIPLSRSTKQLRSAEAYIRAVGHQIQKAATYPPRLHLFCGWCDYRLRCETYQQALRDDLDPALVDVRDLNLVSEQREHMAAIEKTAKQRRRELDRIIKKAILQSQSGHVDANHMRYRVFAVRGKVYPLFETVDAVVKAIGPHLDRETVIGQIACIDEGMLRKFLDRCETKMATRAMLKARLEKAADVVRKSPDFIISSDLTEESRHG